ncbi:hypothetical protein FHW84_001784 [Dyella sp. SG562]|uniref:hypothetical protein n=1 Tax=Dyella sp. SG562 TaxID=2587017 RepID=UPI001422BB10|nr:hypothetical protein [Dyella sp. SG562]NII73215.1 hypothetical protein [Dyella sp. SG562]
MKPLLSIFHTKPKDWSGCMPMSAAERMARYSPRYAAEMQDRENTGAAPPRVRIVEGRPVLVALPGRPNLLPKDQAEEPAKQ